MSNHGILSISHSYNPDFNNLLQYYGIEPGSSNPQWGIRNKTYGYYACKGFPDQIGLYRAHRIAVGGLHVGATFLDCVDSTNTLKMPFKYHVHNPWTIPEYLPDDYDACIRAAVEKCVQTFGYCTILWSGGVDSSTIVAGFIKYADKRNFSVAYSSKSVEEHRVFYEYLVRNEYSLINLDNNYPISSLPGTIINGAGPNVISHEGNTYSKAGKYMQLWHHAIASNEWGDDYNSVYEFLEQYLSLSGKVNPTIADMCIYVNTVTKSNHGVMFLHYDRNIPATKIASFYENSELRRWNHHHSPRYLVDSHIPKVYKRPAKDVIYSVLKDSVYVDTKTKSPSQDLWRSRCSISQQSPSLDTLSHNYFFIDYTGEFVSASSKEEYEEKYQGRFDHYFSPSQA